MDRRKFIKSVAAVGIVAALPLEKLWYPSKEWLLEHSSIMWIHDPRPPFPRIPPSLNVSSLLDAKEKLKYLPAGTYRINFG